MFTEGKAQDIGLVHLIPRQYASQPAF